MNNKVTKTAYAKVNLALDVLGEREDGYHEVRMIMHNLSLADELTFTVGDELPKDAQVPILLTSNREDIPTDERNLAVRAVRLMYDAYDLHRPMEIYLQKYIPVEAGMAGGSTDAAAALHAVNDLYELGLSDGELAKIGLRIGADVPYCVYGKPALSEGIGEKLTFLKPLPDSIVLVAKPPISLSTAYIYTNLAPAKELTHPDIDGMLAALEKEDLKGICDRMSNVLETVSVAAYREIEAIKQTMMINHALGAIMTGSGPTVFGVFDDQAAAEKARDAILRLGIAQEVFLTRPI